MENLNMPDNILEIITKNLGYPALGKIDPNSQEPKLPERSVEQKIAQAAIPAVLTAIYKYSRTTEGQNYLSHDLSQSDDLLHNIYMGNENEAFRKVAEYAGISEPEAESRMEKIADEAANIIRKAVDKGGSEAVQKYMADQSHAILVNLPAALKMGDVLQDETIDDRTNKMEGPVSNLMHKIEKGFSSGT